MVDLALCDQVDTWVDNRADVNEKKLCLFKRCERNRCILGKMQNVNVNPGLRILCIALYPACISIITFTF